MTSGSQPARELSTEELARAFSRGRPEAVEIVRIRVRKILSFRRYGMNAEERLDLEQEVMAQLWQATNKEGFDPAQGFWGFVEVVTARRSIDWLRARRPEEPLDDEASYPEERTGPLGIVLARERTSLAGRALAELPEECRELLRGHFIENRSYRELAKTSGKTEGALRVQVYRSVRETQRILDRLTRDAD